jgi:hypothetical protein
MAELDIDIKKKFLDANGLSTFWNNVVAHIDAKIQTMQESNNASILAINQKIETNKTDIKSINDSLNSYRGYQICSLDASNTSFELLPNTYYTLHLASSKTINITLTLNANANVTSEYVLEIDTTNGIPTLGLPAGTIIWENDDIPEFENGYRYLISIVKNSSDDKLKAVYGQYKL